MMVAARKRTSTASFTTGHCPVAAFRMLLIFVCAEASVLGVGIVAAGYAFLHLIMCGVSLVSLEAVRFAGAVGPFS